MASQMNAVTEPVNISQKADGNMTRKPMTFKNTSLS